MLFVYNLLKSPNIMYRQEKETSWIRHKTFHVYDEKDDDDDDGDDYDDSDYGDDSDDRGSIGGFILGGSRHPQVGYTFPTP